MSYESKLARLERDAATLSAMAKGERLSFYDWLHEVNPTWQWDWSHVAHMRQQLERVTSGEIKRLMLFLPPRHGKTSLVTVRYAAWRLECDPTLRVILGAYNQRLAERFSRKVRRIARDRFPLDEERRAADDWQTPAGGGIRAAGVGAGITGIGGDLIIIDDPLKSREEANSPAYKSRVEDWYTNDIYTRQEPGAAIILIQTRWSMDDLAGRILDSPDGHNWTVVTLPATAEEDDPLGRQPGEALCPDRYDEEALAEIRIVLGNADFTSLYQQQPFPREGALFKRAWFETVDTLPDGCKFVRWWDKAGTSSGGDYTAGVLMARDNSGFYYVVNVARGQWSSHKREQVILETAERDSEQYGNVDIWLEQEPGSGGKESAESSIRNLAGFNVHAERSTGDKATRADPYAAQCEAGNVRLVTGPWTADYLDELTSFPHGRHDDQVDGSSGSFSKLTTRAATWEDLEGLGHVGEIPRWWTETAPSYRDDYHASRFG